MPSSAIQKLLDSNLVWRSRAAPAREARWDLAGLSGRLVELSGSGASAALSVASGLVLEAQRRGEPVAWIEAGVDPFFAPDLAAGGVDLASLVVVRAGVLHGALGAADTLLRSGGFGLLVLDLAQAVHGSHLQVSLSAQTRLASGAKQHDSVVLLLTRKAPGAASVGSLVSLHARAVRRAAGSGRFGATVEVLKDKRHGPGWIHEELLLGPPGLL